MSAYLCSHDTIKLIALHATKRDPGGWDLKAAQAACETLWAANCDALRDRYPSDAESGWPEMADAPRVTPGDAMRLGAHKPIAVIKVAHCYDYQACEWQEWEGSDAQRLSESARYDAITRLEGYESAPWGL